MALPASPTPATERAIAVSPDDVRNRFEVIVERPVIPYEGAADEPEARFRRKVRFLLKRALNWLRRVDQNLLHLNRRRRGERIESDASREDSNRVYVAGVQRIHDCIATANHIVGQYVRVCGSTPTGPNHISPMIRSVTSGGQTEVQSARPRMWRSPRGGTLTEVDTDAVTVGALLSSERQRERHAFAAASSSLSEVRDRNRHSDSGLGPTAQLLLETEPGELNFSADRDATLIEGVQRRANRRLLIRAMETLGFPQSSTFVEGEEVEQEDGSDIFEDSRLTDRMPVPDSLMDGIDENMRRAVGVEGTSVSTNPPLHAPAPPPSAISEATLSQTASMIDIDEAPSSSEPNSPELGQRQRAVGSSSRSRAPRSREELAQARTGPSPSPHEIHADESTMSGITNQFLHNFCQRLG